MRLSGRMDQLGTESAFAVGHGVQALRASGRDVIELHIGEPDFDTPPNVVEAARRALEAGHTHYAPPLGAPAFREAIAADFTSRRGVPVEAGRVVVTPGAKPVLSFSLMALVDHGDEVILPDPGFPIYASMVRYLGATPVALPLRPQNDHRPDLDELRALISPRTRVLIINSPHNPTGGMLTPADLEGIASLALAHDLFVISDEIYARLAYEQDHRSILEVPGMEERVIVLDGLSKAYAMTGWRLGWGIMPDTLVGPFERVLINTVSCTATYAQLAGVEALTGPQAAVQAMVEEFRARRSLVVEGLAELPGLVTSLPAGAFYVFPDVSATGMDGSAFADRLLSEAGVSVLAGSGFGLAATDSVRISYANSRANLATALERMRAFLEGQAARP